MFAINFQLWARNREIPGAGSFYIGGGGFNIRGNRLNVKLENASLFRHCSAPVLCKSKEPLKEPLDDV